MAKTRVVTITIRYNGARCVACRLVIPVGSRALFDRWGHSLRHEECYPKRVAEEYPEPTKPEKRTYGMPHLHSHETPA